MKRSWMLALSGLACIVLPALAEGPGEVTAVSVLPGAGRALVIVDVRGSVNVQDFTLANPARLVIDVQGAQLRAPELRYDGANRGGIMNIRYSQFRPDVVRIVLEMESLKDYELEYADDAIRIQFGTDRGFTAWSSTAADYSAAAQTMPVAPARTVSASARTPLPQQSQQAVVTASYDNASIAEVLVGFSELTGRTIVLGKDVSGTVTAEIRNQPWDVAFKAILDAQGLRGVEEASGIIRVDTRANLAANARTGPMITEVVPINFAQAVTLAQTLAQTRIAGDSATAGEQIVADALTNSLIVSATEERLASIRALVQNLDRETPQVSIQARIINVSRTDLEGLGIQYDFGDDSRATYYNSPADRGVTAGADFGGNSVGLGGDAIAAVANAGRSIASPTLELLATTAINRFNISTFIQVLKQVQLADEQAEPLISTADNTAAEILVGEETPIRRVADDANVGSAGAIELIPTGIQLTVTPHVTANRKVLLTVRAENSSAEEVSTQLGFKFNRQRATSQILVDDGQTAVIGGLTRTQVSVTKGGIPYLMDLPILGSLFSVNSRREVRSDLLILVTPRIIDPTGAGDN